MSGLHRNHSVRPTLESLESRSLLTSNLVGHLPEPWIPVEGNQDNTTAILRSGDQGNGVDEASLLFVLVLFERSPSARSAPTSMQVIARPEEDNKDVDNKSQNLAGIETTDRHRQDEATRQNG